MITADLVQLMMIQQIREGGQAVCDRLGIDRDSVSDFFVRGYGEQGDVMCGILALGMDIERGRQTNAEPFAAKSLNYGSREDSNFPDENKTEERPA